MDFFLYNKGMPMLFTQLSFWLFFGIVMLGYSFLYNKPGRRNLYLLFISLFFYYKAGGSFLFLLLITTVVNYFLGLLIARSELRSRRKGMLLLSLFFNLGILAYFKYSYFFIENLNSIFGTEFKAVNLVELFTGMFLNRPPVLSSIILPIGISFYTFQIISYSMEVYRRKIPPVKNFIDFGFYITFFPSVISGPIVKSTQFVSQIRAPYSLTREDYEKAIFLIP